MVSSASLYPRINTNSVYVIPFVAPTNPGATPTYYLNANASRLEKEKEAYDTRLNIFREYLLVENTLKQLLLTAVEEKYYHVICNSRISYTNITTRTLIQHIYTSYGDIISTQLSNNDTQMRSPYDPNQSIEFLYEKIDSTVAFAASVDDKCTAK